MPTARVASFSLTGGPAIEPTTPGSRPPCPGSMKTVLADWPRSDGYAMQAPASRPATGSCAAASAGSVAALVSEARLPALVTREAATRWIRAMAQTATSAVASAVRSRRGEPCRRRVRGGTLRAVAIGLGSLPGGHQGFLGALRAGRALTAYLIREFSARAAWRLSPGPTLRMARITRNFWFCQSATNTV
jgi:hypothetical protein